MYHNVDNKTLYKTTINNWTAQKGLFVLDSAKFTLHRDNSKHTASYSNTLLV